MKLRPDDRRLYEISKAPGGSFVQLPFALLLRAHWEHERTLVIEARHDAAVKIVTVRDGIPVDCDSNQAHEWLGRLAVAQRWIPEREVRSALVEARRSALPLGLVLVGRGLVEPAELNKLLRQGLAAKLLDLFSWQRGEFVVRAPTREGLAAQKIQVPQLILTGVSRYMPGEAITQQLHRVRSARFQADPRPSEEVLHLSLTLPQRRVLGLLREGAHSLAEIIRATRLPLGDVERTVYGLGLLGVVGTERDVLGVERPGDRHTTQEMAALSIRTQGSKSWGRLPPDGVSAILSEIDAERRRVRRRREALDDGPEPARSELSHAGRHEARREGES
jgi:hypothetical protein